MRNFALQILGGVKAFVPLAMFWAVVATLISSCSDDPHPERHESLPSLVVLYFSMALSGGAVFGALRKWATTDFRFGAMSVAVALPLAGCLLLMVNEWKVTMIEPWEAAAFGAMAVLLGPPLGFYFRTRYAEDQSSGARDA